MPDPTRATISATEASGLFDVSPYVTRWMLYRRFRYGEEAFTPEHNRMYWGKKMEPLLLEQAAQDLKFEVRPNRGADGNQVYVRNGLLGCTRDAEIFCPDRGPGVLETKCVFDYATWMREWDGGNKPPRHHEIQIQQQMKVGDGKTSYKWGVEAVWIAGELIYFERKPIPKFWAALDLEAARFFDDVKNDNEPDPFGATIENPLMNEVWPVDAVATLDLREDKTSIDVAEACRQFQYHSKQRLGHQKAEEVLKARFRALAKENGTVLLPHGISITVKQMRHDDGRAVLAFIPPVKELAEMKRRARPAPEPVLDTLLENLPSHAREAMILTLYFGFRKGEVFGLEISQVDFTSRGIWLRAEDVKDSEDAFLPGAPTAMAYLKMLVDQASARGQKRLITYRRHPDSQKPGGWKPIAGARTAWARVMDTIEAETGRRWRWHDIRAAYITHVAINSGPVAAQKLARHSDYDTTRAYIEVADEVMRGGANMAADRPALKLIK